jgi:excisionase family DNA binding protein
MIVPGWLKVKDAAKYAGVSERTLEDWLKQGLKYAQIPSGLRLIRPEWIDNYLEQFIHGVQTPVKGNKTLKEIMKETARELGL